MEIGSIRHKALREFAHTGRSKGLPSGSVDRLRKMLAWLSVIEQPEELRVPPNYGAHQLTGDRRGQWSLTVTKNWRMTFWISDDGFIEDVDLEDYH